MLSKTDKIKFKQWFEVKKNIKALIFDENLSINNYPERKPQIN